MKEQVDLKGIPVTGEDTYQLDFSSFNKPGRYHIHISGIGNSWPFDVSKDTIGEAFYTHTRGLYHKRCGIAKESPYTNWHMGACHQHSFEGGHLPYDHDYKLVTHKNKSVNYRPFQMVQDWWSIESVGYRYLSDHGHMGHISDSKKCGMAIAEWWETLLT
jgi:hypothetical protein